MGGKRGKMENVRVGMDFSKFSDSRIDEEWPQENTLNYANPDKPNFTYNYGGLEVKALETVLESQIKIQHAAERMEMASLHSEIERERRKAQIELLEISGDGELMAYTANTRRKYPARSVCNMKSPAIIRYFIREKAIELYEISFTVGSERKKIFVQSENLGTPEYLLRKFTSAGVYFYQDKKSHKLNHMRQFIALMMSRPVETIEIPVRSGWFVTADKKIRFWDKEELTWQNIMKKI